MMKYIISTLLLKVFFFAQSNAFNDNANAEYLYEGDIKMLNIKTRKVSSDAKLWPNAHMDYIMDPTLSKTHVKAILESIEEWKSKSCITFTDQTNNSQFDTKKHHARFTDDDDTGCWSYMGAIVYKPQAINIGGGCEYNSVVIHEIGHALGFWHEQSRTDRDNYIKILKDNYHPSYKSEFLLRPSNNYGVKYDYLSIMHYGSMYFSKNYSELNTIRSLDPRFQYLMGTSNELSFKDENTANRAYCTSGYATACGLVSDDICNEGYLQRNCTCKCPVGTSGSNCQNGVVEDPELPCGGKITSAGTYTTPDYPKRADNWFQRSCVWIIKAPINKKVNVFFDNFSFRPRYSAWGRTFCFYDIVEVRTNGINDEGKFNCGNSLNRTTFQSINEELVILIKSKSADTKYNGMKFTVNFV